MVRLRWKEGPAIRGLLGLVILCVWLMLGVLSSFVLLPIFGGIAVYAWLAGSILVVYMLNQSRKHFKGNVFDDRLSTDRMSKGEEHYIEDTLRRREDEAQQQSAKTQHKN